jgi:hypothetical protein
VGAVGGGEVDGADGNWWCGRKRVHKMPRL